MTAPQSDSVTASLDGHRDLELLFDNSGPAADCAITGSSHWTAADTLICFSHLRWDFVFQRPQHLLTRFARTHAVYYVEEPVFEDVAQETVRIRRREGGLRIVTPVLPHALPSSLHNATLGLLLDRWMAAESIGRYGLWYYTPMALGFSAHLEPLFIAYDCMDELSGFKGAPTEMELMERLLLERADVVFTGGESLYRAKRALHANIHALPSSIDRAHFAQARSLTLEPADQRNLRGPRLGFFGVIDERFDIELVEAVAALRPDWSIVLIGPVVKIDPATLPQRPNIHYLGMKAYAELPAYLAGWDVAIMPFARNASTRFISPTKTPEYLAGGRPVVSTSIHDVVHPYHDLGLVHIADAPQAFVAACERAIAGCNADWLQCVDAFLARNSWDATWRRMDALLAQAAARTPVAGRLSSAAADQQVGAPIAV